MLHNVEVQHFSCPGSMREGITNQLGEDIVSCATLFEIGYFKGNKRVWIQNDKDTSEVQRLLRSDSKSVTLWCMGKCEPKTVAPKHVYRSLTQSHMKKLLNYARRGNYLIGLNG